MKLGVMQGVLRCALVGAVGSIVSGCAHAPHKPDASTLHMDPIVFTAKGGTVTVDDPADPFERASAAYREDHYEEALGLFDEVAAEHPDTQHARSSLYNAGLCLEQLGRRVDAMARFRKLADRYPSSPEALDALFRLGQNRVLLKDWTGSEAVHDEILQRDRLTLSDQVEALARLGEARFERGQLEDADRTLRRLRELYRAHETEERLDTDYFLAMGAFYLAEVTRAQYRLLPVRLPQRQLEADLEAKARLVLLAQQRYLDTIRVKHGEWATAAGFRIASLYREFYDDLVGAPVPESLKGEAKDVYQEEVKKKVRTLLVKAVSFHEKNVLMAERAGEKNEWVRRSTVELEDLRKLLEPGPVAKPAGEAAPIVEPQRPLPPPRDLGGSHTTL